MLQNSIAEQILTVLRRDRPTLVLQAAADLLAKNDSSSSQQRTIWGDIGLQALYDALHQSLPAAAANAIDCDIEPAAVKVVGSASSALPAEDLLASGMACCGSEPERLLPLLLSSMDTGTLAHSLHTIPLRSEVLADLWRLHPQLTADFLAAAMAEALRSSSVESSAATMHLAAQALHLRTMKESSAGSTESSTEAAAVISAVSSFLSKVSASRKEARWLAVSSCFKSPLLVCWCFLAMDRGEFRPASAPASLTASAGSVVSASGSLAAGSHTQSYWQS